MSTFVRTLRHTFGTAALLTALIAAPGAEAACTSPAAPVGSQNWNGTAFDYCDGTTWKPFGGSQWINGPSSAIYYYGGNVGIGTTAPIATLDVNNNILARIRFSLGRNDGSDPTSTKTWHLDNNGDDFRIFQQPNLSTAGQTYLVIKDGGYVGIGTNTATNRLDINGAASIGYASTTAPSNGLIIKGNVGIGTIAPVANLQIGTGLAMSWGNNILINFNQYWDTTSSRYESLSSGHGGMIWFDKTTGILHFGTGSTNTTAADEPTSVNSARLTILPSGEIGVGTSNPGQALTVAGTIESTTGGIKFPDGTTQTTAASATSLVGILGGACNWQTGVPTYPATACNNYNGTISVSACATGWSVVRHGIWIGGATGYFMSCIHN